MRRIRLLCALATLGHSAWAQDVDSTRALPMAAIPAILKVFAYDSTAPFEPRILERRTAPTHVFERLDFIGAQGTRVPALLATPRQGARPYPVVLLLHAGTSSKEGWWRDDTFERSRRLTEALLESGFAVMALDAQHHGERALADEYKSVRAMYFQKQFAPYRDMVVSSSRDYRRALDYLATRTDLDVSQAAVIGHSMGGLMSVHLAAADARIHAAVLCVAAMSDPWIYPFSSLSLASAVTRPTVLVLSGATDEYIPPATTENFFRQLATPRKTLEFLPSGHQLPTSYQERVLTWLRQTYGR